MTITENTYVEDMLDERPEALRLLLRKGVRCVVCGEPVWGTIGDHLKDNGIGASERKRLIQEIDGT